MDIVSDSSLTELDKVCIRDLLAISGLSDETELKVILEVLFSLLNEGSLYCPLDEEFMEERLGSSGRELVNTVIKNIESGRYSSLVTTDIDKPIIFKSQGRQARLYFQRYFQAQRELAAELQRLAEKDTLQGYPSKKVWKEIFIDNPVIFKGKPIELDTYQLLAVFCGFIGKFVIISGGPGTGKTSVVTAILRGLVRAGIGPERIALAAPTGRATQRMKRSLIDNIKSLKNSDYDKALLGIEPSTIHRLLRYSPHRGKFLHNEDYPLPFDLVIVDESSMIDVEVMVALLNAIGESTRLILIGDKNQLPSVEAGAVFADLVSSVTKPEYSKEVLVKFSELCSESGGYLSKLKVDDELERDLVEEKASLTDRIVVLQKSFRSNRKILEVAERINRSDRAVIEEIEEIDREEGDISKLSEGIYWLRNDEPGNYRFWKKTLLSWVKDWIGGEKNDSYLEIVKKCSDIDFSRLNEKGNSKKLEMLFDTIGRARILTVTRQGRFGCDGVNSLIIRELWGGGRSRKGSSVFLSGMPIMVTQNDYARDLYNGDTGIVLRARGECHAVFEKDEEFVSVPIHLLPFTAPAFAITVHKSQGSEFDRVLVVLPVDEKNRLLSVEILYTAITRARTNCLLFSSKKVLEKCIETRVKRFQ